MKALAIALAGSLLCWSLSYTASAATEKIVYSFCNQANCTDGKDPQAGLISVKGILYGTTAQGGQESHRHGTVFSLDPATGAETVLYAFRGGVHDAAAPIESLLGVKGTLYGTSYSGGAACGRIRCGTIFSVRRERGGEKVLHFFQANGDGTVPRGGLIEVGGFLYGTTSEGGAYSDGTVFSFDPATATETILHSLQYAEGDAPSAGLINVLGTLYGTAYAGGTGYGSVFSYNPASGVFSVLHPFDGTDGWAPWAGLVDVSGILYGTTNGGGTYGAGTVFSVDPRTGSESVLHSFETDYPQSGLTEANGILYGTTTYGGAYDRGTVFSIDPASGAEQTVHSFGGGRADGDFPVGGLVPVGRALYGTTVLGGAHRGGTVFSITP